MILIGKVVKVCSLYTVSVLVTRRVRHLRYGKLITRTKKYLVHDSMCAKTIGELVRIEDCAPVSKRKRWRVLY